MSRRCRSCSRSFRPDFATMRLCWPCWRELRYRAEKPPTIVISPLDTALLLQAISLVHPDKHPAERAALCNRVTAALVEALTAIREAA